MLATRRRQLIRLAVLAAVLTALFVAGKLTGVVDQLSTEKIRVTVKEAGPWGWLLFTASLTIGQLLYVPGMIFVAAAVLAYGKVFGFSLSLFASIISVSISFFIVRLVGGKMFAEIERPLMKRVMARLDQYPITTVIVLRVLFAAASPLNYGLALSSIRYRDYLVGSAIGLIPPMILATFFFEWLLGVVV